MVNLLKLFIRLVWRADSRQSKCTTSLLAVSCDWLETRASL